MFHLSIQTEAYQHILFEIEGAIAYVTMNRPAQRNALSLEHMKELLHCFKQIQENRSVAVVVLRGAGPAFCAGHDLKEMRGETASFYRNLFGVCSELMETIQTIPQPVIAQVQGIATAAGCQLVATCDLAVAADTAVFATPGVKIGLFCSTPMVALSRAIGRKKAMEMLLTGEAMSAQDAVAAGLINRAVAEEKLTEATEALARKIAEASPYTVGIGKQAFYKQMEMPQSLAYSFAREVMSINAVAEDAHEGICAFLEKRPPIWRGR
jgi:enoyl-CoA hydratase/carnithine racemase